MKKFITSAYSRLGRFVVIAVAGCIFSACSDFLDVPLESTVATSQAQNFQPKHVIFPIPQDVIDASNGKIEQNPLWK